ncbi:MAG: twin-arginine translocase TatA/TatE family subunit [Chloroflexi bacterium]|nr:twin-arginine translocase TatA/TatE family subunit [Chloroflexota bacterium]
MFSGLLQPTHLLLILAIVLIVFGAGKLPDAFGAIGKGVKEFRESSTTPNQTTTTTVSAESLETAAPAPTNNIVHTTPSTSNRV